MNSARHGLWTGAALGGAILLGAAAPAPAQAGPINRPNILYILADDLGYGDVQRLNPEGKIHTPNLDRLAAGGLTFTDAHSGSAVCTPTRYGILTGRYSWRSRLKNHEVSVNIIGATAVLVNRITLLAVVGGNEVINPFMVTEVYVQQDRSWKLASLSFTRLLTPEQHPLKRK